MTRPILYLILFNVLLTSLAQVTLKAGMSAPAVISALEASPRFPRILMVFAHPLVILGLSMYVIGAFIWMVVLSKTDVGLAYPFVSLGFIVTMILGAILYGEVLTAGRIAGTLLIMLGVVVLARG